MKGITEIILTDQNGNVERYVEENMVTNAFDGVYNGNPYGLLSTTHTLNTQNNGDLDKSLRKVAGGLLCYPQAITEDATHLFESFENFPTGYSSNDAYSGDDNRRGSFNETESGRVDGGYKFVFDFATNQANGLIKCLALTHYKGGKGYYSSSKEYVNSVQTVTSNSALGECFRLIETPTSNTKMIKYVVCYNDEKMLVLANKRDSSSGGAIYEVPYKANAISYESFVETSDYVEKMAMPAGNIIRGKDYFYTVTATATVITYKKYNINCELVAEGAWAVPGVSLFTSNQQRAFAHDGGDIVYYFNSSKSIVYKINTSNLADVVAIPITYSNYSEAACRDEMAYIDGCLWLYGGIVGEDDTFHNSDTIMETLPFRRCGVWLMFFVDNYNASDGSRARNFIARCLQTNYLATINNLSGTGVTKTPDKTMKVIYTLYA